MNPRIQALKLFSLGLLRLSVQEIGKLPCKALKHRCTYQKEKARPQFGQGKPRRFQLMESGPTTTYGMASGTHVHTGTLI